MKKLISFIVVVMLCSTAFAQLRVASNGNAAIKLNSTVTPLSPLTVGGAVDSCALISALKETVSIKISSRIGGVVYGNWCLPFLGENTVISGLWHAGVKGASLSNTPKNEGRAFGVLGQASNAKPGYNYGVFGTVGGTNNGAGVVGTTDGNIDVKVLGKYAGYFVGNVVSTGTVTAVSFVTSSDSRLKTNITSLSESAKETGALSKVLSLNPVQYNLKQMYTESEGDSAKVSIPLYDEKSQQFQKTHFGLIAQELQKVYPELVYEQDNGYLSVDYVGLIPLLIQSMKEMKAEIDVLKSSEASRSIADEEGETIQSNTLIENLTPALYQNTPNPFSQQTEIKYYIPANIKTALLCIYDL